MKRMLLSGALCLALVCSAVPAACAAETAAAAQTQTVKTLTLKSVERAVRENNATVQAMWKKAYSRDSSSSLSAGGSAQSGSLEAQFTAYESLIDGIEAAMATLDRNSDLYKTYAAQKQVLENNVTQLRQQLGGLPAETQMSVSQVDDVVYTLKKQAENVENQLAKGAQDLLLSIRTLQNAEKGMQRQLDAHDRQLNALKAKRDCGMVSDYTVDTMQNTRDNLALNLTTLQTQYQNMAGSLALMCGCDAQTLVYPSGFDTVSDSDLRAIRYEDDLESALKGSYSIWLKRSNMRSARNRYDSDISGTGAAVDAARDAMEAECQAVENAFDNVYKTVGVRKTAVEAAQQAEEQAQRTFETAVVKYERGMISKLELQDAQDTLASAQDAVEAARIKLLSAYTDYQWAKQGVVSTSA